MASHPDERGREDQSGTLCDRYLAVRAAFVAQGTSLNRWCVENGVSRSYAVQALRGFWPGAKGRALRAKIIRAAGLTE